MALGASFDSPCWSQLLLSSDLTGEEVAKQSVAERVAKTAIEIVGEAEADGRHVGTSTYIDGYADDE